MEIPSDVEEYICAICREILINPVTLPCKHTCCCNCLEKTLDYNKYQCFLCRKFIGSWYRNAKKRNELVNELLWKKINEKFTILIKRKLNGESIDIFQSIPVTQVSNPGEIKEEFKLFAQQIKNDYLLVKEKEDKLSEEFIKKLQEEENKLKLKKEQILKFDEEFARELTSKLNSNTNPNEEDLHTQLINDEQFARMLAEKDKISTTNLTLYNDENDKYRRKLRSYEENIDHNKKKISVLKLEKSRKGNSKNLKIIGPMDRFLGKTIKK